MENQLSEQQSLKIIQEMIATSKDNLKDNSFFYLLWGWLVLGASLIHFGLLQTSYEYPWIPWPIMMAIGGIVAGIAGHRMGKDQKTVSHVDRMIMFIWQAFGVVLFIILFMSAYHSLDWYTSNTLIMVMYGMGTYVSGRILKFKPLVIGGIAAWAIAIFSLFVEQQYILLLIALSIIIAYLIPGYMLKAKA